MVKPAIGTASRPSCGPEPLVARMPTWVTQPQLQDLSGEWPSACEGSSPDLGTSQIRNHWTPPASALPKPWRLANFLIQAAPRISTTSS